mmetsp:Transcript_50647/g.74061  ORF Transcript_50647/g.74061 Transcript_50647/m.74061 type:complete len:141 (+) Transcript_50647:94-516(+)
MALRVALKRSLPEKASSSFNFLFQAGFRSQQALKMGEVEHRIMEKLNNAFNPSHIQVINESSGHNVPAGSETHFKVIVVSSGFEGKSLIQRHRLVNSTLREELEAGGVHALSIVSKTPEQWEQAAGAVAESPRCMGGSKK